MAMPMRCECGKVRGEVDLARAWTRGTCYCKDCQAYARWLGRPQLMDARGGTDVVPLSPASVRVASGMEHVACMSLSGKGILRWYAACCRTPLGNTPRSAKLPYFGLTTVCLEAAPDAIDALVGPRDRIVFHTKSATGPVRPRPLGFLAGVFAIVRHLLAARRGAPPPSPFLDAGRRWLRTPLVLDAAGRAALGANRA
jgi:hypothetical protein